MFYHLLSPSYLYYSIIIINLQYIDCLQSSVILVSYLSPVLHPYIAHCQYLLTGGSFLPFKRISTSRTPHATCIFMSHRISQVKPSPLQIRALHYVVLYARCSTLSSISALRAKFALAVWLMAEPNDTLDGAGRVKFFWRIIYKQLHMF